MLNLPNFLTLVRILTIPVFLEFLAYHLFWEALVVFAIGGLTDFLDGFIARRTNQETALGAYLDPVADKLLVITSYIMLGAIDGIPMWLALIVVLRDLLILTGYGIIYILVNEPLAVRPSLIGKWSTTFQLLTLAVALALLHDPKLLSPRVLDGFVWLTALGTVVSGCHYLYRGLLWLQKQAPSIGRPG
ncbi:MAG TPA: CDP-diacylglycerol--glycerol-3-phosphate 3-phosphatidyltransferase [Candidatus Binatia bacterium]|nr:CDP-diacylglycerol--glycerol-3-phosphate 3-phosphatidyltransferase [Candidatus Binatia bacterium]